MSEPVRSKADVLLEQYAPLLKNLIRFSSAVNAKDIKFYKSLEPRIRDEAEEIDANLVGIMNEMVISASTINATPNEGERFKVDSDAENTKVLSNVLDTLLERVELNLDNHYRARKNTRPSRVSAQLDINDDGYTYLDKNDMNNPNSGHSLPARSNPNMDKPQAKFLDPVDNFEKTPFKPLIKFKPNAMKPLDESLQLVEATDEIPEHYENPYSYEIMNAEYPSWILEPVPLDERYESIPWEGSPAAEWIDSPEQLSKLLIELNKCKVFAIDLEHHDYRTYHGLTSLMQITTDSKKDYLIDPLSPQLRPHLPMLNEAFTNPNIVKVLHGAFMDVIWLQRDLGLYLVSLFDTFHAAKQLSLGKYSLAFLLEEYVRFRTSKKWQLADWRIRPLSSEMMDYAKADTHFLIEVFYKMHDELLKIPQALQKTLYASRKVAIRRFEYSTFRPKNLSMSSNNAVVTTSYSVPLTDEVQKNLNLGYDRDLPWTSLIFSNNVAFERRPLLEILFKWRDQEARKLDESSRFIMSDFMLISLINAFQIGHPENVNISSVMAVINKTSKFGGSFYVRKIVKELTEVIKNAVIELEGVDLNELMQKIDDDKNELANQIEKEVNKYISEDAYENVKDVNKLGQQFGHFIEFYNRTNPQVAHSDLKTNISTIEESSEDGLFSIKYGKNGKAEPIKNRDINDRISKVVEFFTEEMGKSDVTYEIDQEDVEEFERKEMEPEQESKQQEINERDEIITLRKKQSQSHNPRKRKMNEEVDLSIDFNKSIMNMGDEGLSRREKRNRKQEQNKPSFNPYGTGMLEELNVPKLKKKKIVERGKNVVFKKK